MSNKEWLIEKLYEWGNKENDGVKAKSIADYLLNNYDNKIVILPCDKVYYIVDKNSPNNAMVANKDIEELSIYEIRNLSHYGYYLNKWEAEEAMKKRK